LKGNDPKQMQGVDVDGFLAQDFLIDVSRLRKLGLLMQCHALPEFGL
jgi:hypothetical protein